MLNQTYIDEVKTLLAETKQILVLTGENPTQDGLGASLALFLSLSAAGKNVKIACPSPATVEFSNLVGIDKMMQNLSGNNFVISLDYGEGSIEKVSYNIANNKFNLVIEPKPNAPAFSADKVSYSSGAADPDLIFILNTSDLVELGKFYNENKDMFTKAAVVNIDKGGNNTSFGRINLLDPDASSVSEMIAVLLPSLGLALNEDSATNLLLGLAFATDNFSPNASPQAFEAAAACLKAGGKRTGVAKKKEEPIREKPVEAPADWLQPKIFKSGSSSPPKDGGSLL
jgi:nanoRNase/pAp phosphatase (c-di-AMP/oligoRNAs hydrolase)